jgi:hypothetical protein
VRTTNLIGVQTLPALLFHFIIIIVVVLPVVDVCRIVVVVQSDRGWHGFLLLQERQSTHQATAKDRRNTPCRCVSVFELSQLLYSN